MCALTQAPVVLLFISMAVSCVISGKSLDFATPSGDKRR
jgi:hypothetical protein